MPDPMQEALAQVTDPELRSAIESAYQAAQRTPEEIAAEERERKRRERKEEARELRAIAHTAMSRALEGEWGDDVRRAVDQLIHDVRPSVSVLAEWAKRIGAEQPTTPIEWTGILHALGRDDVKEALRAADKIIRDAERERREKGARK